MKKNDLTDVLDTKQGYLVLQVLEHYDEGQQSLSKVESEIMEVFGRSKFARYLTPGRIQRILDLLVTAALVFESTEVITDCRDAKDNKYLELALAAGAELIVTSDSDLLILDPWRGVRIMTPGEYVRRHNQGGEPEAPPK